MPKSTIDVQRKKNVQRMARDVQNRGCGFGNGLTEGRTFDPTVRIAPPPPPPLNFNDVARFISLFLYTLLSFALILYLVSPSLTTTPYT